MNSAPIKTPVHLWIVGALALIWNGYGCYDFIMTQMKNPEHLKAFSPEQQEYWASMPLWTNISWALGVWGGVIGAIGLLMRKRFASLAFLISLLGLTTSMIYTFVFSNGYEVGGNESAILYGVLFLIASALLLYAKHMQSKSPTGK